MSLLCPYSVGITSTSLSPALTSDMIQHNELADFFHEEKLKFLFPIDPFKLS